MAPIEDRMTAARETLVQLSEGAGVDVPPLLDEATA